MKFVVFLPFALFSWSDAFGVKTVPSLNVNQYLGRWYQVSSQLKNCISDALGSEQPLI